MFRRLPNSRLRLLPVLWTFWLLVAAVAYLGTVILYHNWGDVAAIQSELRYLDARDILLLLFLVSPFAILLGSLHYAILRFIANRTIRTRSKRELWIGGIATLLLTSILAVSLIRYLQYMDHLQAVHFGYVSEGTFSRLTKEGNYEELIDEMEIVCARFDQSKAALDGKFTSRSPAACGFCYLYTELHPGWDSLSRLAPRGLIEVLQSIRIDHRGDQGDYGPWRPIAEEMKKSKTPILHVLGCFLLDDHAGFAESTYRLADGGNRDYEPLAARAALLDPNPARSVNRMLIYENFLVHSYGMGAAYFEKLLIKKALTALQQGDSLAPHEERLHKIAESQDMSPVLKSWFRLDTKKSGE